MLMPRRFTDHRPVECKYSFGSIVRHSPIHLLSKDDRGSGPPRRRSEARQGSCCSNMASPSTMWQSSVNPSFSITPIDGLLRDPGGPEVSVASSYERKDARSQAQPQDLGTWHCYLAQPRSLYFALTNLIRGWNVV